jgi:hypothetical protein
MERVTEDTARAALRSAIEARGAATGAHEKARAALRKCDELLRKAEGDALALGDVADEIARHRAASVRQQLDEGATVAIAGLPRELSNKQRAQAELAAHAAAVRSTRAALAEELVQADSELAAAHAAVGQAALGVLVAEACRLSDRMGASRERACALYDRLHALASCWLTRRDGRPGPTRLPLEVLDQMRLTEVIAESEVHRRSAAVRIPGTPDPIKEKWEQAHAALCEDADAELPDA